MAMKINIKDIAHFAEPSTRTVPSCAQPLSMPSPKSKSPISSPKTCLALIKMMKPARDIKKMMTPMMKQTF